MSEYEPELGQAFFGQSWQRIECPPNVQRVLDSLQSAWSVLMGTPNPFSNTGERFDGKSFRAHAYSWDDDEHQEFNFAWRDVRVSWYKYLGRGTSINRRMSNAEVAEMFRECMSELLSINEQIKP